MQHRTMQFMHFVSQSSKYKAHGTKVKRLILQVNSAGDHGT